MITSWCGGGIMVACALVVDADDVTRRVLSSCFEVESLSVSGAGSASEARTLLGERTFDLVTLEVDLWPDGGLPFARELRSAQDPAILIVSSNADRNYRIAALNDVADDYIVKPFDVHEVLARARAVLRRRNGHLRHNCRLLPKAQDDDRVLRFSGYALDAGTRQITIPSGTSVDLTATEFRLLEVLIANPHRVLSRERLLELSGGNGEVNAYDRAIDMRIQRLRGKLGDSQYGAPDLIRTVRGVGYAFAPPDRTAS